MESKCYLRLSFEKLVFEKIGEASMCWSETPKGVFDSTRANEIANEIIKLYSIDMERTKLIHSPRGET